ncbi:hypothetical protein FOCC_FOCC004756 [Frankliniella occidentalis]|nr:hypothetical protein FOCC_FOCC004756 [Frankliniella occidentalis]
MHPSPVAEGAGRRLRAAVALPQPGAGADRAAEDDGQHNVPPARQRLVLDLPQAGRAAQQPVEGERLRLQHPGRRLHRHAHVRHGGLPDRLQARPQSDGDLHLPEGDPPDKRHATQLLLPQDGRHTVQTLASAVHRRNTEKNHALYDGRGKDSAKAVGQWYRQLENEGYLITGIWRLVPHQPISLPEYQKSLFDPLQPNAW